MTVQSSRAPRRPCGLSRSGLGWAIVACAWMADALALASRSFFPVVLERWESDFGWSRSTVSAARGMMYIVQGLVTPCAGHVADVVGPRAAVAGGLAALAIALLATSLISQRWMLWLVFGFVSGAAFGCLNLNVFSATVINYMPPERRGRAVGIATSGSTCGQLMLVPLFALVTDSSTSSGGWRLGYRIAAAAALALVPVAAWLLDPRYDFVDAPTIRAARGGDNASGTVSAGGAGALTGTDSTDPRGGEVPRGTARGTDSTEDAGGGCGSLRGGGDSETPQTGHPSPSSAPMPLKHKLRMLFRSSAFWALTLSFTICGVTTTGFVESHIIALATHRGMSATDGAVGFGVLSACNGLGMIAAGWLSDRYSRTLLLAFIFGIRALTYVLLHWVRSVPMLMLFGVLFGFVDYSVVPPTVSLVETHMGSGTVGLGVGILLLWHSLGASAGAYAGGVFFDADEEYGRMLLLCVGLCALAALSVLTIPEPLYRNQGSKSGSDDAANKLEPTRQPVDAFAMDGALRSVVARDEVEFALNSQQHDL